MSHDDWRNARLKCADRPDLYAEIPFGPRGCVGARQQLARSWRPGHLNSVVDEQMGRHDPTGHADLERAIDHATIYWVSSDMVRLWQTACRSLPDNTGIPVDIIDDVSGLVFVETHIEGTDSYKTGATVPLMAMHWVAARTGGPDSYPHLSIDWYSYSREHHRLFFVGGSYWPLGVPMNRTDDADDHQVHSSQVEDRRLFAGFVSLLQSPGVCATSHLGPDRAGRRRAEREQRPQDLDAVRIIYLRNLRHRDSEGSGGIEYHHRWVVTGHWRSQPYGPNNSLRRQTWIRPYVKGPEDAPLLTGDKVYAVVR